MLDQGGGVVIPRATPDRPPSGAIATTEYRVGRRPRVLPGDDAERVPRSYSGLVRTDRGWKRFYATGWIVSCLVTVAAMRQWNGRVREAEQRAAEIERTHEATARSRAAEERLRIARDLHDSLTHSISVVKMQAGVAVHLARKRGEQVPESLLAIEEAATEASRELRETLRVLRRDEVATGAGLGDLPRLIARCAGAGLQVELQIDGSPRELPGEVDTAAYRIVQEALTNTSRHAGVATASVTLDYGAECLEVRVCDEGVGKPAEPHRPGLGLIGMRERAAALGGSLVAYAGPDKGFTVHAVLPMAHP